MIDLSGYRKDFPMLAKTMHGKPLVYFDSAATAQKPFAVIDAIRRFYAEEYGTVHRAIYELSVNSTKKYQETREKVRRFIHAKHVEEIIFTRGTTDSINIAASSFGKAFIKPGDEILISEMEHHSNIVPWQFLEKDLGAVLKIIPVDDRGEIDLNEYAKLLSEKTKLVAVTYISNSLGTLNPIQEMVRMAHAKGAKFLVDGAQAAPHMPIDVQALDCDFFAFSAHKIYGPTGVGILYGKKEILEEMPPYQGGGDMIDTVAFGQTTYNSLPLKFEAGTPMIAEVMGLNAALDYINAIGIQNIQAWEHELLQYATQSIEEVPGLRIIGTAKEKGAIISFIIEGVHPLDIGTMLDLRGVALRTGLHCTQPIIRRFSPKGTARASFGLYNTKEEIDYFIQSLKEAAALLKA